VKIIGLTGMASCGKSTIRAGLVYNLKKQGYKVADIHEVPRAHYGPINKDTTELSQVTMLSEQIKLFILFCRNNSEQDIIITDRTPMDFLAYSKYYKIPHKHWLPTAKYYTNLYDRIYYIMSPTKMENDGVRNTNKLVEETIAGYLEEMLFSHPQIADKTKIIRNYEMNPNIVSDLTKEIKEMIK
jgi:thymidylate kinase